MAQPIVYIDTSAIREGRLEQLKAAMNRLATFVETNVPQLISYGFFLDESQAQMTVVAVHPDSASLEFHMDVGADEFRRFADFIDLLRIEVYGQVSAARTRPIAAEGTDAGGRKCGRARVLCGVRAMKRSGTGIGPMTSAGGDALLRSGDVGVDDAGRAQRVGEQADLRGVRRARCGVREQPR